MAASLQTSEHPVGVKKPGPNAGRTASTYRVTLPDGRKSEHRSLRPLRDPVGYAYRFEGVWFFSTIGDRDDPRFKHLTVCDAVALPRPSGPNRRHR